MTRREVLATWRRFQRELKLQDWTLEELRVSKKPPGWVDQSDVWGYVSYNREDKSCKVWVQAAQPEQFLMSCLLHEFVHIALADAGLEGHEQPAGECLVECLAAVLAKAWEPAPAPAKEKV